jgi:hypothetical protein
MLLQYVCTGYIVFFFIWYPGAHECWLACSFPASRAFSGASPVVLASAKFAPCRPLSPPFASFRSLLPPFAPFLTLCLQADVNEPPALSSMLHFSFYENIPIGTIVYNATAVDVDAGDRVTISIPTTGNDNDNNGFAAFVIDASGHVLTASNHDFESGRTTYMLLLALTDEGPAGPASLVHTVYFDRVTTVIIMYTPVYSVEATASLSSPLLFLWLSWLRLLI